MRGAVALPFLVAAALGPAAAGCADDDDGGPSADARPAADGGGGDAGPCTVLASYGDAGVVPAGSSRAELTVDMMGPRKVNYTGTLNADQDLLVIELIDGYGVFSAGLAVGTYALTGDELNYSTCGACVRLLGDVDAMGNVAQDLMATGGSLVVSELGAPVGSRFAASLSGATFEHVTIDPSTYVSTPVGDGCVTELGFAGADVTTVAAP